MYLYGATVTISATTVHCRNNWVIRQC